jgi:hypothetical protein
VKRRKWLWMTLSVVGLIVLGYALIIGREVYYYRAAKRATAAITPRVFDPACGNDGGCKIWAQFRAEHPFPYQAFAAQESDGQIVLVLSEPAPNLSKSELQTFVQALFGPLPSTSQNRRWPIGDDGWLEDVVLTIQVTPPPTSESTGALSFIDSAYMRERLSLLHVALYGTVYGGQVEAIGQPYAAKARGLAPNIGVRPDELRSWLGDVGLQWSKIDSNEASSKSVQALIQADDPGPYVSSDARLVLLILDKSELQAAKHDPHALAHLRVPFRVFAVASDCVLGALWGNHGKVGLLARARQVALDAIPPLRFETFEQLARESHDELAQSYERNNLFAGKMMAGDNRLRDWAPIYLSPSLIDTEFGALLNITDQMLKSWSEAGNVEYEYFQYPLRPQDGHFAFGDNPLMGVIANESNDKHAQSLSVLFNWNTSGSALITNYQGVSLLTTKQTGALPVTYGAETSTSQGMHTGGVLLGHEDHAYDYFARLGDPSLARVVSYTLIYQTLRAIAVKNAAADTTNTTQKEPLNLRHIAAETLVTEASSVFEDLIADSLKPPSSGLGKIYAWLEGFDDTVKNDVKPQLVALTERFPDLAADHQLVARLLADPRAEQVSISKEYAALEPLSDQLEKRVAAYNKRVDAFNVRKRQLASLPANAIERLERESRAIDEEKNQLEALKKPFDDLEKRSNELDAVEKLSHSLREVLFLTRDFDSIRQRYVAANAAEPAGRIKTPSVVVSWSPTEVGVVGGHNLTARALKIEVTSNVADLEIVDRSGDRILLVNPSREAQVTANAPEIARAIEHDQIKDVDSISALLKVTPSLRTREGALGVADPKPVARWAGYGERPVQLAQTSSPAALSERLMARLSSTNADAVLTRNAEGFRVAAERNIHPPPAMTCCVMMKDSISVVKYLTSIRDARGGAGRIVFEGEPVDHVAALAEDISMPGKDTTLNDLARTAGGSGGGKDGGGVYDILSMSGDNRPISIRVIPLIDDGARGSPVLHVPRNWATAQYSDAPTARTVEQIIATMNKPAADVVSSVPAWDSARDGSSYIVEMRFGASDTAENVDATLVAGLDPARVGEGQALIREGLQAAREGAASRSQSLLEGLARLRAYVDREKGPRGSLRRLNLIVEGKRLRFLLTKDHRAIIHAPDC